MSKPRKKAQEASADDAEVRAEPVREGMAREVADQETPGAAEAEAPESGPAVEEAVEAEPDPLDVLRAERDSFQEKWLRAVAEMENIRKRARRDILDTRRFAQADLLRPLLEVHDNFERALQSLPGEEDTAGGTGIRAGIDLIFQKFRSVLKDQGVEPIPALDEEFNPKIHEAVGQVPREGVEAGVVIEVVQPGFRLGGELVLRPARVIIAG